MIDVFNFDQSYSPVIVFRLPLPLLAVLVLPLVLGVVPGCDSGSQVAGRASTGDWFTDVAGSVGIDFVHETGAQGDYQLPEIIGSGCAWIDYDLDGDLDVFLIGAGRDARSARNRLFRNDAQSSETDTGRTRVRFTDVTRASGVGDAGYGMGCAVGDYDADGDPDIYVTCFGRNRLYRNAGDGTFEDVTDPAGVGDPRWSASGILKAGSGR